MLRFKEKDTHSGGPEWRLRFRVVNVDLLWGSTIRARKH